MEPAPQSARSRPGLVPVSASECKAKDETATPRQMQLLTKTEEPSSWQEYQEGVATSMGNVDETEENWIAAAEAGNLELFTICSLSLGSKHFGELKGMVPKFAAILFLQVLVPVMMVMNQLSFFRSYPREESYTFRMIGFSLYMYSVANIYSNACDECRIQFLEIAIRRNASWDFLLPVFLGEIVNMVSAITLVICLFNIFCRARMPEDLILNSVAINYIGNIDNEFVDEFAKKKSISRFKKFLDGRKKYFRKSDIATNVTSDGHYGMHCLSCTFAKVKFIGTWVFGVVFGLVFLLSHERRFCGLVPHLEKTLLCLGVGGDD